MESETHNQVGGTGGCYVYTRTQTNNEVLKSTYNTYTPFLVKHNPNAIGVQILCVCLAVSQYLHACRTQGSDHRHTSNTVSSSEREAMRLFELCELDLYIAVLE